LSDIAIEDAARILGIEPAMIHRWIRNGIIRCHRNTTKGRSYIGGGDLERLKRSRPNIAMPAGHPSGDHVPLPSIDIARVSGRMGCAEFVYFFATHDDWYVKIGTSNRPDRRLGSAQTHTPHVLRCVLLVHGDRRREQALHRDFRHEWVHGEWFYLTRSLRRFVEQHQRGMERECCTEIDADAGGESALCEGEADL
jgi:hypothetical protein